MKAGNKRALSLFGFGDPGLISVSGLKLVPKSLAIGDDLQLTFTLTKSDSNNSRLRLEYAVDYVKARGKLSRKIFQIKEADYLAGSYQIARNHSFKELSTRKHYPGPHIFTILVNGVEKAAGKVELA